MPEMSDGSGAAALESVDRSNPPPESHKTALVNAVGRAIRNDGSRRADDWDVVADGPIRDGRRFGGGLVAVAGPIRRTRTMERVASTYPVRRCRRSIYGTGRSRPLADVVRRDDPPNGPARYRNISLVDDAAQTPWRGPGAPAAGSA